MARPLHRPGTVVATRIMSPRTFMRWNAVASAPTSSRTRPTSTLGLPRVGVLAGPGAAEEGLRLTTSVTVRSSWLHRGQAPSPWRSREARGAPSDRARRRALWGTCKGQARCRGRRACADRARAVSPSSASRPSRPRRRRAMAKLHGEHDEERGYGSAGDQGDRPDLSAPPPLHEWTRSSMGPPCENRGGAAAVGPARGRTFGAAPA